MMDRDLALLYEVKTSRLNEQVKRNLKRFPKDFMFQLNKEEFGYWKSQNAISDSDKVGWRKLPFVFTEHGVSMLSSVLKSEKAIEINIAIMRAFISMRNFLNQNIDLIYKFQQMDHKFIEQDIKINKILNSLELEKPKQGIFYDGQIYDAYLFVSNLIKEAKHRIILIDNYIDETILTLFSKKNENVKVTIHTKNIPSKLKLDIEKFNQQYKNLEIKEFNKSHDRFLVIDNNLYHFGASLKDLGKKWMAFSKIEDEELSQTLISKLF